MHMTALPGQGQVAAPLRQPARRAVVRGLWAAPWCGGVVAPGYRGPTPPEAPLRAAPRKAVCRNPGPRVRGLRRVWGLPASPLGRNEPGARPGQWVAGGGADCWVCLLCARRGGRGSGSPQTPHVWVLPSVPLRVHEQRLRGHQAEFEAAALKGSWLILQSPLATQWGPLRTGARRPMTLWMWAQAACRVP